MNSASFAEIRTQQRAVILGSQSQDNNPIAVSVASNRGFGQAPFRHLTPDPSFSDNRNMKSIDPGNPNDRSDHFATTRWSIVLAAGGRALANPGAEAALSELCIAYWIPLYAFARRRGLAESNAADATQAFFVCLLEKDYLKDADPERGRFRSFLLTAFKRFLSRERDFSNALKRGGGVVIHSLNASDAESKCGLEPSVNETAEAVFERRWALTLLDRVLQLLEGEYQSKGRSDFFAACRGALIGTDSAEQYSEIAERHGMTEGSVKVAIHRMRTRYRELLRIEVGQTVASAEDIDDELRSLMDAVGG